MKLAALFLAMIFAGPITGNMTVTSVSPVVVLKFQPGATVVFGPDGIARTCPDQKGVGVYVRVEGKNAPNSFQYVMPGTMIPPAKERGYTIACLKVE